MSAFKMDRSFYIPRESAGQFNVVRKAEHDAEVYTYANKTGLKFGAVAFHGKAAKPDWHYTFTSSDHMQRKIREYFDSRREWSEYKAKQKAERSAPHTLKVGDILVASWGYDQTNIDYYQVTRIPGPHSVEVRQICAKSGPEEGFMTAYCTPAKDQFKGEPMLKRCNSSNSIYIASYASASPWDGKPNRYSWYA